MKPNVSFEMMSIIRDTLDIKLVKQQIEFEEWVELVDSLHT